MQSERPERYLIPGKWATVFNSPVSHSHHDSCQNGARVPDVVKLYMYFSSTDINTFVPIEASAMYF